MQYFDRETQTYRSVHCSGAWRPRRPRPSARADVITDWNATAQAVLVANGHQGPPGFAFVHVPMYDAVNAIDGGHSVFAVRPVSSVQGASKEAAAATAAYRVLRAAPTRTRPVCSNTAYAASLAAVPDGPAKTKGIAIGTEVADGVAHAARRRRP